jgi:Virulence-associated protein and related proteins
VIYTITGQGTVERKSRRKRKPAVPVVRAKEAVVKGRGTAPRSGQDQGLKRASLFMNGRSQAVRLPKEFRFEGTHVYARKEGNRVILFTEDDWMERLLAVMGSAPDFPDRDQGVPQERPELDDLFP